MKNIYDILPWLSAGVGAWCLVNGILHDIFVLAQRRPYDRDLLRLLLDGHVLITCGIMQLIACKGLMQNADWSYYVSGVATLSLVVYCFMIYPFLKSFVTTFLNLGLFIVLIISYFNK